MMVLAQAPDTSPILRLPVGDISGMTEGWRFLLRSFDVDQQQGRAFV